MKLTNKEIRAILSEENLTPEGRAMLDAVLDEFVPDEDAIDIIKRKVQDAINHPEKWNSISFTKDFTQADRKIAAIKCLRQLSEENITVKRFFGISDRYPLGLAEAKNFVETNFNF